MARHSLIGAAVGVTVLVLTVPVASAGAGSWQVVDQYASPSGDVIYGIQRRGDLVRFRLDSFVDFGAVDFCVRRASSRWVCREVDLTRRSGPYDIYRAQIRWQGNYPTTGGSERRVRFMTGSPTLRFTP